MEEIMESLLAKIKRKKNEPYRRITSGKAAFEEVDITTINCLLYAPEYKLDDDEWFKIENFDQTVFCLDILKNKFINSEYNDIDTKDFVNISYLISVQNNCFYFQNITPSSFIRLKILVFGEVSKIVDDNKQIFIKKIPDAIYDPSSKTLFFKNLSFITGIFKDIGKLYKEATQKEVDAFLDSSFIKKGEDYDTKKVSSLNRKLVTVAMDALHKLTPQEQDTLFVYVNRYSDKDINYCVDSKSFEIKCENDLKTLLYGIHQRFYTTPIGDEQRVANSVKVINK
tara:strand:- start:5182 stop:6030 length:849 start_codon:yes stop_codon:yes gene_type:complete